MTSEQFNEIYDEFEILWAKNQAALDALADEIGDDGFAKIGTPAASDELLGKFSRWQKLCQEQDELRAYPLPEAPTSKNRE